MLKNKGFTLLEMLLVLAILALLFSLVIFSVRPANLLSDTKTRKAEVDTSVIKTALDSYKAFKGKLPDSFSLKSEGVYEICTYGALACPAEAISLDELVDQRLILNIPVFDDTNPNLTGYKIYYDGNVGGELSVTLSNEIVGELPTPTPLTVTPTPPAATGTPPVVTPTPPLATPTPTPLPTPTPAPTPPILAIGDTYGGGKVAFIDGSGFTGFISDVSDQSSLLNWTQADTTCSDLVKNGYSDWFLPTISQLGDMYTNRVAIGGFNTGIYWSSSTYFSYTDIMQIMFFDSWGADADWKTNPHNVRCVRTFDNTPLSNDLTNIVISGSPYNFNYSYGVYNYNNVIVLNNISSVIITPTGTGIITIDGVVVQSGNDSASIDLTVGVEREIQITVQETNKLLKTYSIKIIRSPASLTIGDTYQGGKVAYILQSGDPGYDPNLLHGITSSENDQGPASWGCNGTSISGADGTAVGTGSQNTSDIVNGCTSGGIAARVCSDLDLNGYTDWYLPSKDELNQLYINRVAIGNFNTAYASIYWSSSETSSIEAWYQVFYDGYQQHLIQKQNSYSIRCIRSFNRID
ncbi:DUF1566 domain-containing protein [Candidatus Dojkabacteria bacterium]|nr:DUF1566 domain-containing protein [Candidatus Dojkabacteria bacterium]